MTRNECINFLQNLNFDFPAMTKEQAEDFFESIDYRQVAANFWDYDGIYYLRHGEASRPVYRILHRKHGWYGIKKFVDFFPETCGAETDHFLTREELCDMFERSALYNDPF